MLKFNSLSKIKLTNSRGTVFEVEWFEDFESIIGENVIIDNKEYIVKGVDRNHCSGFFFGTNEQWEHRNVYINVEE